MIRGASSGVNWSKPWAHLAGRSMHGGSGQTWRALYRLGLLYADDKLTERGQYEAAARVSRKGEQRTPSSWKSRLCCEQRVARMWRVS
ncbi:hypothetical protein GAY31_14715 [Azospirillum brasilense]|nr:hypothetical protein [Azospirillum brasilense]